MDHRFGVSILKLVCAENFKLFGPSDSELTHFQDLDFPLPFNEFVAVVKFFHCSSKFWSYVKKYLIIQNKVTHDRTV